MLTTYKKRYEIKTKKNEEAAALLDQLEDLNKTKDHIHKENKRLLLQYKKDWRMKDDYLESYQ